MESNCKDEAFLFLLQGLSVVDIELGIERGSFHHIYERHKNKLLRDYFNGNTLKYSVTMATMFRPYNKIAPRLNELAHIIHSQKTEIKLAKKYGKYNTKTINRMHQINSDMHENIKEYNNLFKPLKNLLKHAIKIQNNG